MGVAYYIVLDNAAPGFDTFVNGKALAHESERLDAISKKLGIRTFEDFLSISAADLEGMLGDDVEIPEQDVKWFSADEGLSFVQKLLQYIRANPSSIANSQNVLEDLEEYAALFQKAKGIGARWHLTLDI